MTNWLYKGEEINEQPEGFQGFVYLITNLKTGKKYIGKKNLVTPKTRVKTVTLKNGTKKKKKFKEYNPSDWQDYFGSNDVLRKDVEDLGPENFKREILHFCKSKGEMTYWESYYQFVTHSILSEEFYNTWIMCRVRGDHIKKIDLNETVSFLQQTK